MTCPACEGETDPWVAARGSEPTDTARYALVRCRVCGTAATTGPPPPPSAYASGIYSERPPRLGALIGALHRLALRLPLRLLRRAGVGSGASVLDAGAGRGRLVAALRSRGYSAEGIDSSPRSEGVARAAIAEHTASDLDAVVLWHVLEHVPDPAMALARVRGWLGPGGVVVIAVPNVASLQARIAGAGWFHLDVPRHRTHFTPRGLRELMARAGLEPERTRHLVPEHNFYGMWFALLSRIGVTPGLPFHVLKRNVRVRPRDGLMLVVGGPLLLLPAVVLELVAVALRRGGTIAVVGRAQGLV